MLKLGILDQSPVVADATPAEALNATVALVRHAERLGYQRFWFAEHHGRRAFADTSPELLVARCAAETQTMRLGTGGVLLGHYQPLKVAETFRLLCALAPGRVDLGLGRASGSDRRTERALRGPRSFGPRYEARLHDLLAFLGDGFAPDHPFASIRVSPAVDESPDVWLLGSSDYSASLAAAAGLPFAYAHFIAGDAPEIARAYYEQFVPSARCPHPRLLVAAAAFCSEDPAERDDFRRGLGLWRARVRIETDPNVPSRTEARRHVPSAEEAVYYRDAAAWSTVAAPAEIGALLAALAERHLSDELLLITVAADYAGRLRSYQRIAEACLGAVTVGTS